jgi:hypothetical protein
MPLFAFLARPARQLLTRLTCAGSRLTKCGHRPAKQDNHPARLGVSFTRPPVTQRDEPVTRRPAGRDEAPALAARKQGTMRIVRLAVTTISAGACALAVLTGTAAAEKTITRSKTETFLDRWKLGGVIMTPNFQRSWTKIINLPSKWYESPISVHNSSAERGIQVPLAGLGGRLAAGGGPLAGLGGR